VCSACSGNVEGDWGDWGYEIEEPPEEDFDDDTKGDERADTETSN
jgi:hypothetical protein